jgi:hypothetical protein
MKVHVWYVDHPLYSERVLAMGLMFMVWMCEGTGLELVEKS